MRGGVIPVGFVLGAHLQCLISNGATKRILISGQNDGDAFKNFVERDGRDFLRGRSLGFFRRQFVISGWRRGTFFGGAVDQKSKSMRKKRNLYHSNI